MDNKTVIDSKQSNFKKGLDFQREVFKGAKSDQDVFLMCSCLENIKSEIKSKAIHSGSQQSINFIEKRINWFKTLRGKYTVKTQNGRKLKLPSNWRMVAMNNLQDAYEELMKILTDLELL